MAGTGSIVFLFVYLRQYTFFSFMPYPENLPFIVGLSYVFFRVMQLVIDACNGDISKPPAPARYFNFTCNFLMPSLALSSGIRNMLHKRTASKKKRLVSQKHSRLSRVSLLVFSRPARFPHSFSLCTMIFCQKWIQVYSTASAKQPNIGATASFYTLFLYLNFSGYTDIVVGLGRLFGFTLPENFNKPMNAENFIDLWQRWHMSLANWMRLYVFNPTVKFLAYRVNSPAMLPYLSVIAFFATFMLLSTGMDRTYPFFSAVFFWALQWL